MTEEPIKPLPRGDATRDALLQAALDIFGRDGFHAASTRAIARAAGVNQALIGYHFRGKQGLYVAVFEHIAARINSLVGAHAKAIAAQLAAGAGDRKRDLALLLQLTETFVGVLASPESEPWARVVLREQQDPGAGFEALYNGAMRPVLDTVGRLLGRLRGTPPDAQDTRLFAITLVGQALVFRAARAAVMRHLGWRKLGAAEIAAIQACLRSNIIALLGEEPSS